MAGCAGVCARGWVYDFVRTYVGVLLCVCVHLCVQKSGGSVCERESVCAHTYVCKREGGVCVRERVYAPMCALRGRGYVKECVCAHLCARERGSVCKRVCVCAPMCARQRGECV
jgi:hypothetical protein